MAKVLRGIVVSTKMQGVVVVEVTRFVPHPLYKKLLKRGKQYNVAANGQVVAVGDTVKISETRPMSKNVHFKLVEAIKE